MKFASELVKPTTSIRRVVIELPEDDAFALASILDNEIIWHETDVEDALEALYAALRGES